MGIVKRKMPPIDYDDEIKISDTIIAKLNFTEMICGSISSSTETFEKYIGAKRSQNITDYTSKSEDEADDMDESLEENKATVFHRDRDDGSPFVFDYVLKGMLKASAVALQYQTGLKQSKSRVNTYVLVHPRKIFFYDDNDRKILEPTHFYNRSLRGETMKGPRVMMAKSEGIEPPCNIDVKIMIIENDKGVNAKFVRLLLRYGRHIGIGQARNQSMGRFEVSFL